MCPCISASPGIRNLPCPSIVVAPSGTRVVFDGPNAVMRSPVTTTVWLAMTRFSSIGTADTLVNATTFGGCAPARIEPAAASRPIAVTDRAQEWDGD